MTLKERLRQGDLIAGTFVKTPSPVVVEVLGRSSLDCVCLDGEHSPFDRSAIDHCLLAGRAAGIPVLVRVPGLGPGEILNALDCGAAGIVAPHIRTAAEAELLVRACHYGQGGRGFAGWTRAAGYGARSIGEHVRASTTETAVIAQIEDPEAVEAVDAMAQVPGVDALFVGRVDLTVAYGSDDLDDQRVVAAVERVCEAGRKHRVAVGMYLARASDVPFWRDRGARLFLLGMDQQLMLNGAEELARQIRAG